MSRRSRDLSGLIVAPGASWSSRIEVRQHVGRREAAPFVLNVLFICAGRIDAASAASAFVLEERSLPLCSRW